MNRRFTLLLFLFVALVGCSPAQLEIPVPDAPVALEATTEPEAPTQEQEPVSTTPEQADIEEEATAEPEAPTQEQEPANTIPEQEEATSEPEAPAQLQEPASNIPERIDIQQASAALIADTESYYQLQTLFSAEVGQCLEGNQLSETAVLQGAAFMDDCQNVTGQIWQILPTEQEGFYHLQTLSLAEQNRCLEGNRVAPDSMLDGAAFMNDCSMQSGQLWKFVDAGDGSYRLQSQFLIDQNKCLEGNRLSEMAVLNGAAFMGDCQQVTGQLWKLVPVADVESAVSRESIDIRYAPAAIIEEIGVYYRLQTLASGEPQCLDVNSDTGVAQAAACSDDAAGQRWKLMPASDSEHFYLQTESLEQNFQCFDGNQLAGEAAYMSDCAGTPAQSWKFVDTGDGNYYLQTQAHASQNKCLSDATALNDVAFLDTCQAVSGQHWQLVPIEGSEVQIFPDIN